MEVIHLNNPYSYSREKLICEIGQLFGTVIHEKHPGQASFQNSTGVLRR